MLVDIVCLVVLCHLLSLWIIPWGCLSDFLDDALNQCILLVSSDHTPMTPFLSLAWTYIGIAELLPKGATSEFRFLTFAPHSLIVTSALILLRTMINLTDAVPYRHWGLFVLLVYLNSSELDTC